MRAEYPQSKSGVQYFYALAGAAFPPSTDARAWKIAPDTTLMRSIEPRADDILGGRHALI
jgi:hypothetical protein